MGRRTSAPPREWVEAERERWQQADTWRKRHHGWAYRKAVRKWRRTGMDRERWEEFYQRYVSDTSRKA